MHPVLRNQLLSFKLGSGAVEQGLLERGPAGGTYMRAAELVRGNLMGLSAEKLLGGTSTSLVPLENLLKLLREANVLLKSWGAQSTCAKNLILGLVKTIHSTLYALTAVGEPCDPLFIDSLVHVTVD